MKNLKNDKMKIPCFSCFCDDRMFYGGCCPALFTGPKIFCPNKIDVILHKRFFELCSLEEQYSLAFSVPEIFKKVKLKPLAVISTENSHGVMPSREFNICVNGEITLQNINSDSNTILGDWLGDFERNEFTPTPEEPFYYFVFFKANKIVIKFSQLTADEFLHLLSFKTEILECWELSLTSKCKFSQILPKIPNITQIQINKTNIEIENSWIEDLYNHKNGNNFEKLDIQIYDINFNSEYLIAFIKTKCHQTSQIYLSFPILELNSSTNKYVHEKLTKIFSTHFLSVNTLMNLPFVCVSYIKVDPLSTEKYVFQVLGCFVPIYCKLK